MPVIDILGRKKKYGIPGLNDNSVSDGDGIDGAGPIYDSDDGGTDSPLPSKPPPSLYSGATGLGSDENNDDETTSSSSIPPRAVPQQQSQSPDDWMDRAQKEIIEKGMHPVDGAPPPKTWRRVAAALASGLGGRVGTSLAPLIAYGSKGLEQEQKRADYEKDQAMRQTLAERISAYQKEKSATQDAATRARALKIYEGEKAQESYNTGLDTLAKAGGRLDPVYGGKMNVDPTAVNADVPAPPFKEDVPDVLPGAPPASMLDKTATSPIPNAAPPGAAPTPGLPSTPIPHKFLPPPIAPAAVPQARPMIDQPPGVATQNKATLPGGQIGARGIINPGPGRYELPRDPRDPNSVARVMATKEQQATEADTLKHKDDITLPPDVAAKFKLDPKEKVNPSLVPHFINSYADLMKEENIPEEQKFATRQKIDKWLTDNGTPLDARDRSVFLATGRIEHPPSVNVNAGVAAEAREYNSRLKDVTGLSAPLQSMTVNFSRLFDSLAANTPVADALLGPELIVSMAGGAGSGVRINDAEIRRVMGSQNAWSDLQTRAMRWLQSDRNKPFAITAQERNQMRELAQTFYSKVQAKKELINQANQDLLDIKDPTGRRQVVATLKKDLSDIDEVGINADIAKMTGGSAPAAGAPPPGKTSAAMPPPPPANPQPGQVYPKGGPNGEDLYRTNRNTWTTVRPSKGAAPTVAPQAGPPVAPGVPQGPPPPPQGPPPPQAQAEVPPPAFVASVPEGKTATSPSGKKYKKINGQLVLQSSK